MIKLIASDLDDTLLDRSSQISMENKRVVREVLDRGLTFTIATGRMFQATAPFARELGFSPEQPLICYNGALIKRLSGEVLYHRPLPVNLATTIAQYGQARGWTVNLYYNDELYVASWNQQVEDYANLAQVDVKVVEDLGDFIQDGNKALSKILIVSDPQETPRRIGEIQSLVGSQTQIVSSREKFMEITTAAAHKGAALLWLAHFMGLRAEEVMAIGDSNNDVTMLKMAGIGVAVANASSGVKAVADFETSAHYEHGVARALNKFVLGK